MHKRVIIGLLVVGIQVAPVAPQVPCERAHHLVVFDDLQNSWSGDKLAQIEPGTGRETVTHVGVYVESIQQSMQLAFREMIRLCAFLGKWHHSDEQMTGETHERLLSASAPGIVLVEHQDDARSGVGSL